MCFLSASREARKYYFLSFYCLEYRPTDGIERKKNLFPKITIKKVPVGPFQPTRAAHRKTTFYLRVALDFSGTGSALNSAGFEFDSAWTQSHPRVMDY